MKTFYLVTFYLLVKVVASAPAAAQEIYVMVQDKVLGDSAYLQGIVLGKTAGVVFQDGRLSIEIQTTTGIRTIAGESKKLFSIGSCQTFYVANAQVGTQKFVINFNQRKISHECGSEGSGIGIDTRDVDEQGQPTGKQGMAILLDAP